MEGALNSFVAFTFFASAFLLYVFSLFCLTFVMIYEAHQPGQVDPKLRVILDESLPMPDWRELRTLMAILFGLLAVLMGFYLVFLQWITEGALLFWVFLGNKITLTCGLLQMAWFGFYWRLRDQKRRRRYFLENLAKLDFKDRAQLKRAGILHRRLNIRNCMMIEKNRGVSVFFRTRQKTLDSVNGVFQNIPSRFLGAGTPIFISDDHLDYLQGQRRSSVS